MFIINKIQKRVARKGGDIWRSWSMLALWPWPCVMLGAHHGKFTWQDYRAFTRHLRPGDFLLTKSEPYFLSNMAIAGTSFKHLAVYTGAVRGYQDQNTGCIVKPKFMGMHYAPTGKPEPHIFERTVTHAISDGVVTQDLGELLFHADYVAAVRPATHPEISEMIVRTALKAGGLEYNFDFKPSGPPALYCTELGAHCLDVAGIQPPDSKLCRTSLIGTKSPVVLADYYIKFPMIVCSQSCNDPAFYNASAIREPMRSAIQSAEDANSINEA